MSSLWAEDRPEFPDKASTARRLGFASRMFSAATPQRCPCDVRAAETGRGWPDVPRSAGQKTRVLSCFTQHVWSARLTGLTSWCQQADSPVVHGLFNMGRPVSRHQVHDRPSSGPIKLHLPNQTAGRSGSLGCLQPSPQVFYLHNSIVRTILKSLFPLAPKNYKVLLETEELLWFKNKSLGVIYGMGQSKMYFVSI